MKQIFGTYLEFFILYRFPVFKNNFYELYKVLHEEMIPKIDFIGTTFNFWSKKWESQEKYQKIDICSDKAHFW